MKPGGGGAGAKSRETGGEGTPAHGPRAGGADRWWVVSAVDVFAASMRGLHTWPTVLRPASVAQRVEEGRSAAGLQASPAGSAPAGSSPVGSSPAGASPGSGEQLCALAFPVAESAEIRAVHWYRGAAGTVIAETACGPESSVVLVGWAPYDPESQDTEGAAGSGGTVGSEVGAGSGGAAARSGGAADDGSSGAGRMLPGALLLGIFDTRLVALRLAELVGESAAPRDTVVIGRWSLPEECAPMPVRSVIHPEPGVLRRELVAQISEAFLRLHTHGRPWRDENHRSAALDPDSPHGRTGEQGVPR